MWQAQVPEAGQASQGLPQLWRRLVLVPVKCEMSETGEGADVAVAGDVSGAGGAWEVGRSRCVRFFITRARFKNSCCTLVASGYI